MPLIGGQNYNNITIPRWNEIDWAAPGIPYADATQAGTWGIRKDATLQLKSVVRPDGIGKEQTDAFSAECDLELWQDDIASLQNVYLLSAVPNSSLRLKAANGDWWNFQDNTANPPFVTPNGSRGFGMDWTFECDPKNLGIKLKYMNKMHPKEFDWMTSNAASGQNPGSSGSTITGLVHQVYNQAAYGIPGIVQAINGTDDMGYLGDGSKITLASKAMGKTLFDQSINSYIEVTADIELWQSKAAAEFANIASQRNADFTLHLKYWTGLELILANSTSMTMQASLSDTKNMIKVHIHGLIPYDKPLAPQANIIFNTGSNTLTLARIGYV